MRRVLGGIGRWAWYLGAVLVVLCAVVVSIGQYYFPYLDQHKDELVAKFAGQLPFGLEMGGLHAEWTGLAPTFHVNALRLYSREDPSVTILSSHQGEVRIDLVRSLLALKPRLRSIEAEHVELGLLEEPDGRWHIAGTGSARAPSRRDEILAFFLAIESIELRHTRIELSPASGGRIDTEDAQVTLENYRHFRRLSLAARDAAEGGSLELVVEASGDPRVKGGFDARAWLKLDEARLARFQPLSGARALPQGVLSGELWASFDRAGALSLQGQITTPELALPPLASGRQFDSLRNLDASFALDWTGGHGTLWVPRLQGQWYGQDLSLDRLRLDRARSADGWRNELAADYLELGALSAVALASGTLPEPWSGVLADLAPYGGLAETHVVLETVPEQAPRFELRARMVDFSASPWESAPGVRNVRGLLRADAQGGRADIDSGAVTLEFPHLYGEDLDFDSLRGSVSWQRDAEGLEVASERMHLVEGATAFDAMFRLRYYRGQQREDSFSLAVGLRNGDVSLQHRFVPTVVDAKLREWLDQALRAGHVEAGMFALRTAWGRADEKHPLSVQLALDADGAAVDYHPDWPAVSEARARVQVDEKQVRVWAEQARVLDSRIDEARVALDLEREPHRLSVRGRLHGDLADGLRVIDTSPLAHSTRGILHEWQGAGPMQVALDLDLPLGKAPEAADSRIEVRATVDGARLAIPAYDLQLEAMHGSIDYSLAQGLRSKDLKGSLWGRPLSAELGTGAKQPGDFALQAEGSATVADLERWMGASGGGSLEGETAFSLRIAQDGERLLSRLDTDLAGLESRLPAPLAKSAADTVPLAIEWWPLPEGIAATATLGTIAKAALQLDKAGAPNGEIVLGEGDAPHAGGAGLRLRGHVADADAGAWIVATQRLLSANAGRASATGQGLRIDGLQVDNARMLRATLHGARLDSRHEQGDFVLDFVGDLAAGSFRAPADHDAPLVLALERLELQPFFQESGESGGENAWGGLQGARIPAMDISLGSTRLGPRDLGNWKFHLVADGSALSATAINASMPGADIGALSGQEGASLVLRWIDGAPQTEIAGAIHLHDLGVFSDNFGYDRVMESREGHAELAVRWPGNPTDVDMAAATGTMDFKFQDGRLLNEGTNNPLMRAIGVMRFDELLRRLKFDFKDLYQSGLVFDRFQAAIELGDATARTRSPMELEGPSARMRLEGRTDLRARQIDAELIVTLPLGSNLPWVAALAGGPAVAAGVFVASRLFKDEIGRMSSAVYKVSGPLDDPKLEFQKVFDVEEGAGAGKEPPGAAPPATPTDPGKGT